MDLGKRLKELRLENELKQRELASVLDVSRNTYTQYECGTRKIGVEDLIKLADFYNISLDFLVGRKDF